MTGHFATLESRVLDQFAREGVPGEDVALARTLGVRYRLQVHTLDVDVDPGALDERTPELLRARFAERYRHLYGEGALLSGGALEFELHSVVGTRALDRVPFDARELGDADASAALTGEREAYFEPEGFRSTPVYDGHALRAGQPGRRPGDRAADGRQRRRPARLRGARRRLPHDAARADRGVGQSRRPHRRGGGPMTLDPVTFEVIRHRLWAINDDQAMIAARLSGSPIVYEALDFNAALMTGDGRGLTRASTSSSTPRRSTSSSRRSSRSGGRRACARATCSSRTTRGGARCTPTTASSRARSTGRARSSRGRASSCTTTTSAAPSPAASSSGPRTASARRRCSRR